MREEENKKGGNERLGMEGRNEKIGKRRIMGERLRRGGCKGVDRLEREGGLEGVREGIGKVGELGVWIEVKREEIINEWWGEGGRG
jgi:hypothetical protein